MQILCKAADHTCDVRCAVCGQGFLVYWTRSCADDRTTDFSELLCAHHLHGSHSPAAHPSGEFYLSLSPRAGYMESLGAYA